MYTYVKAGSALLKSGYSGYNFVAQWYNIYVKEGSALLKCG